MLVYLQRKRKKLTGMRENKSSFNYADKYRKDDGSYDCVAPGSLGKDSIYAANI